MVEEEEKESKFELLDINHQFKKVEEQKQISSNNADYIVGLDVSARNTIEYNKL